MARLDRSRNQFKIYFLGQGQMARAIEVALKKNFILTERIEDSDLLIVASWGKILKKEFISKPRYGGLNVHPSLLPKYRGPTPIQTALLNGDKVIGLTIIKMDDKMDHGPVAAQAQLKVRPSDTTEILLNRAGALGAQMLSELIPKYLTGQIRLKEQNHSLAIYTKLLKKSDGRLNLSDSPIINERKVRAYTPWPMAFVLIEGKRLIIHKARVRSANFLPMQVQLEGKRTLSWAEFQRGWRCKLPRQLTPN